METIYWGNLIVADVEGLLGDTLESLLRLSPANLDTAVVTPEGIVEWDGFFIGTSADTMGWEIPSNVDWTNFYETVSFYRGESFYC